MKKIYRLFIMLLLVMPTIVMAQDKDKFYSKFEDDVTLNDNVNGSTIIGGNNVVSNGTVDGLGLFLGNNITYNTTSDYSVILGNNININGNIIRDGLIAGNVINFSNTARVNRDIIVMGSTVTLKGYFNRNVTILAKKIIIDDVSIVGDVYTDSDSLIINDNVKIDGTLKYDKDSKLEKSTIAHVTNMSSYENKDYKPTVQSIVWSKVRSFISKLFILLVITFFVPNLIKKIENKHCNNDKIIKNIGIGLLSLIIIPIILLVLFISTISFACASIGAMLYTILIILSTIVSSFIFGNLLWKKMTKKDASMYLKGSIGILIYSLLILIPYIGGFVTFIFVILGFGTLLSLAFDLKENKKK